MKNILIQVNKNGMGGAESPLALTLISKYFQLLTEEETPPSFIVFYNEGVKLLCENTSIIAQLKDLENKGVQMIACSTCLDYFSLLDKQIIGKSGSMQDIVTLQKKSDKVITI